MKTIYILFMLTLITGCGDDVYNSENIIQTVSTPQQFEGVFRCSDSSFIELEQDSLDTVRFDTSYQSLNSLNSESSTFGTHPLISDRNIIVSSNVLSLMPRNYIYSSSTHDLEEDVSGSNITGKHRTDIEMALIDEDQTLSIVINIWSGAVNTNINTIIATRKFNCARL